VIGSPVIPGTKDINILPVWNLAGPVAGLFLLIEGLSQFASVSPGEISVDADVEELAVVGIGVARMGHRDALVDLGALEVEDVLRLATGDAHLVRPAANACLGIEDQASRTGDHVELPVHAEVELVADAGLLMAKVSVLTGTMWRWLWCFCNVN